MKKEIHGYVWEKNSTFESGEIENIQFYKTTSSEKYTDIEHFHKAKLIIEINKKAEITEDEFAQVCINLIGLETTTMTERVNIAEMEKQKLFGEK